MQDSGSELFPNHVECDCQCEGGGCPHLCCFEGRCVDPATCETEECNQREQYRIFLQAAPNRGPSKDFKALADAIKGAFEGLKNNKPPDGRRMKDLLGKAVAPAQHVEEIDHTASLKKCIMFLYEIKRCVIDVDPNDVRSWVNAFDVVKCKVTRHSALTDEVRVMAAASGTCGTVNEAEAMWKGLVRKVLQAAKGSGSITDDSIVRDSYQDAYALKDEEAPAALYARVKTGVVAARWARYWIGGANPMAEGMAAAMEEEVKERFKDALPADWRPGVSLARTAAECVSVASEFHKNSPAKPSKKHKPDKPAPACTIGHELGTSSSSSSSSASQPTPQSSPDVMAAIANMTSALGSSFSAQMGNITRSLEALKKDAPPAYPAQRQQQPHQWTDQPRFEQGERRSRGGRGRGRGRGRGGDDKCYACGLEGHYKFKCPTHCFICKRAGHAGGTCAESYCYDCKTLGHTTYHCRKMKEQGGAPPQGQQQPFNQQPAQQQQAQPAPQQGTAFLPYPQQGTIQPPGPPPQPPQGGLLPRPDPNGGTQMSQAFGTGGLLQHPNAGGAQARR